MTHIGIAKSVFTSEMKKGRSFSPARKRQVFEAMAGKTTRQAQRVVLEFAEEIPPKSDQIRALKDGRNLAKAELRDETLAKLEKVKGRLAHKKPNPSMDELLNAMADFVLEYTNPAKEPKHKVKRSTKAAVKRYVWKRDQAVCSECGSGYAIQVDHIKPECLGGEYTIDNLRLLCRNCNQRAAIEKLGQDFMDPYLTPVGH